MSIEEFKSEEEYVSQAGSGVPERCGQSEKDGCDTQVDDKGGWAYAGTEIAFINKRGQGFVVRAVSAGNFREGPNLKHQRILAGRT